MSQQPLAGGPSKAPSTSPSSSGGSSPSPPTSASGSPAPTPSAAGSNVAPTASKAGSKSKISQSKVPSKVPSKATSNAKSASAPAPTPVTAVEDGGEPTEVITKSQAKANQSTEAILRVIFIILITLLLILDMITIGWEYNDRGKRRVEKGLTVSILITMFLFSICFYIIGLLAAINHNYWLECRYGIGMCFYLIFGIAWIAGYTFRSFNIPRLIDILLVAIIIPVSFILSNVTKKVYPNPWYPSACCGPYYDD